MSEIKIVHIDLENPIILSPDSVNVLIAENAFEFFKLTDELFKQFEGEEGDFVCLKDGKQCALDKCGDIVYDYFKWDFNNKKVLNALYRQIEDIALNKEQEKYMDLVANVNSYVMNLIRDFSFELTFDDLTINDILKSLSLRFETDYETIEEKIVCYVNLLSELKNTEFIVFVNLKSILNDEKLSQLYHHCKMAEISLLLIESNSSRKLLPQEKGIIITEDLCEIVVNGGNLC